MQRTATMVSTSNGLCGIGLSPCWMASVWHVIGLRYGAKLRTATLNPRVYDIKRGITYRKRKQCLVQAPREGRGARTHAHAS